MGKILNSREIAERACSYVACSPREEEVIQNIGDHIQKVHAMRGFSKEFYEKALSAIRQGNCGHDLSAGKAVCDACFEVCLC